MFASKTHSGAICLDTSDDDDDVLEHFEDRQPQSSLLFRNPAVKEKKEPSESEASHEEADSQRSWRLGDGRAIPPPELGGTAEAPDPPVIASDSDFHKMDEFVQSLMTKMGDATDESVTPPAIRDALLKLAAAQPEMPEDLLDKKGAEKAVHDKLKDDGFFFNAQAKKGNPWGGRWQRALDGDEKLDKAYTATIGRTKKAQFRADWAKEKYDEWISTRSYEERDVKKEVVKGKMMSIARICWKEGGGKAGMEAALNVAAKCVILGQGWHQISKWTKQPKFMYIEEGFEEELSRLWSKKQEWIQRKGKDNQLQKDKTSNINAQQVEPPNTQEVGKPDKLKNAAKAKAKAKTEKPSPNEKKRKAMQTSMSDAKKMKQHIVDVNHRAETIAKSIDTDPAWSFFQNNREALDKARQDLTDLKASNGFVKMALAAQNIGNLKTKDMDPAVFESELNKLSTQLAPIAADLRLQCDLIVETLQGRKKVEEQAGLSRKASSAEIH